MLRRTNDGYYLSGDDAKAFNNALNHPTIEKVQMNAAYMQHIDESIHFINSDENGFSVQIDDLDISLINNDSKDYSIGFDFIMHIKRQEHPETINFQECMHTEYSIETEDTYTETDRDEYLSIAA